MAPEMGTSRPIVITSLKPCCIATIEVYLKGGSDDSEGTVVKCATYPKQSNHRIVLRNGKWQAPVSK